MGCSNARLLVQSPMATEPGTGTNNPLPSSTLATSPANVAATDTNNTTTRMHLTGVDLVVERNGSYTLLLTPKTHKQLMPYVLRKKRFRILVDKPRSDPTLISNEPNLSEQIMENNKDLKMDTKKDKKSKQNIIESTLESIQQVASDEFNKTKARFVGGRSIDRGNPEDEDENIQSDDEGMIEEIITTVEEDKDLECKIKKKIETKKTVAQDPETHNTITKVVKTEVTEITRTITINDHHDLERAKRELGIDDVNRFLPSSSSWIDHTRSTGIKEKRYEPFNEIVTSKDFPSDSPIKKLHPEEQPILAESTTVGRGPVTETITSSPSISQQKPIEIKKKKKKSKFCSCTRAADDEHDKPKAVITPTEQKKKTSLITTPTLLVKSTTDTEIQGQQLISSDIKQLIIDKKVLLIEYIHSKIFSPSKLFPSTEQDTKARKISSRILDLLRYDRCSSWTQMLDQLKDENANYVPAKSFIQPMVNTYENLFISKQSNLLNTFSTIHNENDIKNIHENNAYLIIAQTYLNQANTEVTEKQSVDTRTGAIEPLQEEHVEKVINDDEQLMKEIKPTDDIQQEPLPIYNEEHLIKMLADISQHKPITLAEAIAYEYIDIEDPKLGLSNETIQCIKKLFHPLSDESISNLIRVKRSGEYLTDINLAEINPFEKLNLTEPYVYQLQQSFEPTLDFTEKQFRSLTDAILNNKEQYDQLQFDIAHTSLPICDMKDLSINDVSQSDSGYSMTTATHESLASKIKIEFEPIHRDMSIPLKHEDSYDDEKIDLDKANQTSLDKHELNHDLIQIIKMDFNGSDKTIGQAILSRELRLDSTDPKDISYLNSLGIHKEQARILTAFFFPKHSRIIAYSPEPGRFVEAQTTYNPDYPGYKTDTTIIQIQEKQLSADHLAMQRNIHDDRTSPILSQQIIESETIISSPSPPPPPLSQEIAPDVVQQEKTSPPIQLKKRKSSGHGSLLSCFKSKKPKAGTEQQGQATVHPTILISEPSVSQEKTKSVEAKPMIDYSILPDGKRIYIDAFRDRPGLDMSYKPNDFDNRFTLPIAKPASEYERPITPETEPINVKFEIIEDKSVPIQSEINENEWITQSSIVESELIEHEIEGHVESRPTTIESVDVQPEIVEHKPQVHLEPRPATIEPVDVQPEIVEHKTQVHLEPRPATIEPVDVQHEKSPTVLSSKKTEQIIVTKKPSIGLHGAAVNLPAVELVEPGPLPTFPIKVKKSTGGLCASCFGAKSAEKKKKKSVSAPIQQKKSIEGEQKEDLLPMVITTTPAIESSSIPSSPTDESILPKVNIDIFKERNFEKTAETFPQSGDRLYATVEKTITPVEIHHQSSSKESVSLTTATIESPTRTDTSIFSRVNIDTFKERTFQKSSENLPKSAERLDETVPSIPAEPQYHLSPNESIPLQTTKFIESNSSDSSLYSKVNIDTFRERTFQKSSENLPKSEERLDVTNEVSAPPAYEEPHYQLPTNEPASTTGDSSFHSKANIDTFRERTFEKSFESLPKSEQRLDATNEVPASEEPHYQLPTNESVSNTGDSSLHSKANIDTFRERTFEKSFESLPKSKERLDATNEISTPLVEEPHYQLPTNELVSNTGDSSLHSKANIDTFRERTFDRSFESLPKSKERLDASNEISPSLLPEQPRYQVITNESVSKTGDSSFHSKVNIDTFKERSFEKSFESLPKSQERLDATNQISTPVSEEPHYQLPISEPTPITKTIQSTTKDPSIYSKVNIDTFKERTFDKSFESLTKQKGDSNITTTESHYQSASTPVENGYSIAEHNTYAVSHTTEYQQTTPSIEIKTREKIINGEQMTPPTNDIQKSSGDFHPTKHAEEKSKIPEISPINGSSSHSKKKKKTKTEKKSGVFSTFFRHNDHKSKVPALNLPSIDRDLSPNNPLRQPHRRDSDPLHIPSTNLPKLNLPLPTYNRPEVDMTSGSIQKSSEFSIPVFDLPSIPNLQFPDLNKQLIDSNSDLMKVPSIQYPNLQYTLNEQENHKLPQIETIQTDSALASPVDDLLNIQIDHKTFSIETDYAIETELLPTEQKQLPEFPIIIEHQTHPDFAFQLPSPEPILTLPKDSKSFPPSFDDDVPTVPSKIVPAVKSIDKQLIETKTAPKKKSSTLAICSCFGNKSNIPKEKGHTLAIPKSSLPEIEMPVPTANISSTLKTKGPLRVPSNDLPPVDLTATSTDIIRLPTIHKQEKKQQAINETEAVVPSVEIKKEKEIIPIPIVEKQLKEDIKTTTHIEKQSTNDTKNIPVESKKSHSFVIKVPVMNIPEIDLSGPPKSDAYLSLSKQGSISIPEQIHSRSDSGLEAIMSSHIHPSSTFGTHATLEDIQQHPSISSGLGSEILDNMTAKGYSLPDIQAPEPTLIPKGIENSLLKHDFTRKITMNDETRAKLIFRQDQLKICLEEEISKSIDDFDPKKDQKTLDKILIHAIDLIKDKKVTTYPELKQKLIVEHKNEAFIVDPIVRSLYCAIEKQGLDNLDKPEFPLAIRDMVRLPAKQTYDTVTHLNKEATPLTTTQMIKETPSPLPEITIEKKSSDQATKPIHTTSSCLTCGHSKSKSKLPSSSSAGLLDERRCLQLNTHRHELGTILRDHIQASQPPIRKFADHPKESEKILRKTLTLITQPKIHSYEQMRHDLKGEHKQTFYLVDPIIDIIRDTFDHCDITQMNEKTNLNILDSNISQTAKIHNNQLTVLTTAEYNALKSDQLSWLQQYLINKELNEKKLTRKQNKELNKIVTRSLDILSTNVITTWDELSLQLQREYPKANDLCNRSVELLKQAEKDGLFLLEHAPVQDKRRPSSLITDHARQNLKTNRKKIISSFKNFLTNYNKSSINEKQLENYLNKTFHYLEEQKQGQFKSYNDLKQQLKQDFQKNNQDALIEQMVDVIEQAHATNQFDDIEKPEVQILMKDRLDGKPLVIKEMYVSLPARTGAYGTSKYSLEESSRCISTSTNGDQTLNITTTSHRVARGLSWREANERARILFYRGKHPAIHYDEQAAAFDVRMLLETASGGTQEIPVTDSDVHELLNSCGVQWDGVNIISLVDHSEDVVRAAEQAALKVIREKGIVDLRTPPSTRNVDIHDDDHNETVASSVTPSS